MLHYNLFTRHADAFILPAIDVSSACSLHAACLPFLTLSVLQYLHCIHFSVYLCIHGTDS